MKQLILACALVLPWTVAHANSQPFAVWLDTVRQDAARQGVSDATLTEALQGITTNPKVVTLDRKQPEGTKSFEQYMASVVTESRVKRAIAEYQAHRNTLEATGAAYGVQPEYIVALWAIESNFGERMGNFSIIRSLATLAYDGRRSSYFRGELIQALKIIDAGHITAEDMVGSWAGAMGMCQFMPTSFFRYAVDANGDGKINIWSDKEDVFASIANYLSSVGWDATTGWGIASSNASTAASKRFSKRVSGNHDGRGPYFMVGANYDNILKWNRSRYFAIAVGTLADRIRVGVH